MNTSIDSCEIAKFAHHAPHWWDKNGPLKTLHDINPTRLSLIQSKLNISGVRILDVGCGGGILAEAMAQQGADVIGLDAEEHAINVAEQHALGQGLLLEYTCQPLETFTAPAFPIITCMEMLEHVSDVPGVMLHLSRLLAPGGYLFLSTINRNLHAYLNLIIGAEYVLGLIPRQTHTYNKFIKPSELAQVVRSSGLVIESISGMSYNPFTRQAMLQSKVDVNYFLICRKEISCF